MPHILRNAPRPAPFHFPTFLLSYFLSFLTSLAPLRGHSLAFAC